MPTLVIAHIAKDTLYENLVIEKLSQGSQNVTVKGKEPCRPKGCCLLCLAGRSRYGLADSSYAALKSVKTNSVILSS